MYSRAVLKSYIFMKYYMLSKNLLFKSNKIQSKYINVTVSTPLVVELDFQMLSYTFMFTPVARSFKSTFSDKDCKIVSGPRICDQLQIYLEIFAQLANKFFCEVFPHRKHSFIHMANINLNIYLNSSHLLS